MSAGVGKLRDRSQDSRVIQPEEAETRTRATLGVVGEAGDTVAIEEEEAGVNHSNVEAEAPYPTPRREGQDAGVPWKAVNITLGTVSAATR